ncbi:MAG TPA: hypothetical protein VM933_03515 [Acidimicrobiales bacterium]|nr:hypothetical protein [Acidimicrobiales bacterium]
MTIIDFPVGGRRAPEASVRAHPTSRRRAARGLPAGAPPTGQWLTVYEELAACCAEVVAGSPTRVYDTEWEELLDWIRSRLAVLDALKQGGAS